VVVGGLLMVWWLAQTAQVLFVPAPDEASGALTTTATIEGSLFNTLVILAFAGLGVWFWPRRQLFPRRRLARVVAVLLMAYLVWALASLTWSVDLNLSIRRYVQLVCIVIGCVGLGAGFYAQLPDGELQFAKHVVWAGLLGVLFMWLAVLKSGNLDVFDPAWAAKDVGVGTRIGYPIAYAIIAAVYLGRANVLRGWRLPMVLAVLVLSLLAQKARFTIAFGLLAAALLMLTSMRWSWRWAAVLMIAGATIWVVAAVVALDGSQPLEPVAGGLYTYATLDTPTDNTATLTGRISLWDELLLYLQDRPWLGYGFGAFWNPEFMARIWAVVPWQPPVAHDGFLDELLGTGLIGLVLMLGAWLTGMFGAWWRQGPFATLVGVSMLLFLLLNVGDSIMQSYFQFPFYAALTGLALMLARSAERPAGRGHTA
jgi:exopolysaccharide production protein ExoQ